MSAPNPCPVSNTDSIGHAVDLESSSALGDRANEREAADRPLVVLGDDRDTVVELEVLVGDGGCRALDADERVVVAAELAGRRHGAAIQAPPQGYPRVAPPQARRRPALRELRPEDRA